MATAFTKEQIDHLRSNPYTYKVTIKKVYFTKEFKELFYRKRQEGLTAREAVSELGYDPDLLGENRVDGIAQSVKREMEAMGSFHEGPRPRNSILKEESPEFTRENFLKMHHELQYMRQELDFIKKISSPDNSGK